MNSIDNTIGLSYDNPISVDAFLGVESEVEVEVEDDLLSEGPISVDAFLEVESEAETEDQLYKENVSVDSETVATELLSVEPQDAFGEKEHAAAACVVQEAQEVPLEEERSAADDAEGEPQEVPVETEQLTVDYVEEEVQEVAVETESLTVDYVEEEARDISVESEPAAADCVVEEAKDVSVETASAAADCVVEEAKDVSVETEPSAAEEAHEVSITQYNMNLRDSVTEDVNPMDRENCQEDTNSWFKTDDVAAEVVYDSDSGRICVYEKDGYKNSESIHTKTTIATSTFDSETVGFSDTDHGTNYRGKRVPVVRGSYIEQELEAQEWTHDDHRESEDHKRHVDREQRRIDRYERAEKRRVGKLMWFGVFLLLLEVAGAIIAVMNHQELIECCGRSIFSEDESVGERWNKVFQLLGILYIPLILLGEIPTLVIAQEPFFIFNPMIGFLLTMQMIYVTDLRSAYVIFGLESFAMLGQSWILVQMPRTFESGIHSVVNFTLAGMTVYLIVYLTQQGGYCIVDDRIQSVFMESTCNTACIDDASCFRCTGGDDESSLTQCFIRFPEF